MITTGQIEIQKLREFAANVEPDGYLAALFSPEMLSWVEAEIANDLPPNLYGLYVQVEATALRIEEERHKYYAETVDQGTRINRLLGGIQDNERTIHALRSENDELRTENARLEMESQGDQARIAMLMTAKQELQQGYQIQAEVIEKLQGQLKAVYALLSAAQAVITLK